MSVIGDADARMRSANLGSLTAAQVREYDDQGYLILPDLLDEIDQAPARAALTEMVDSIAADLIAAGLIDDPLAEEPFPTRLARLFDNLGNKEFVAYMEPHWRD